MTFFAVRRWYGWGAGPILNLDIGGGSFEMAFGQDELPEVATSVPLGASRLTRDWLAEDPPSAKSVKELRRYIRATLKPAVRQFDGLGRANLVAGTSKTFRSLARIAGAAPSAAGPYVKRELNATDLGVWAQRISAMKTEDRLHLPGRLRGPRQPAARRGPGGGGCPGTVQVQEDQDLPVGAARRPDPAPAGPAGLCRSAGSGAARRRAPPGRASPRRDTPAAAP